MLVGERERMLVIERWREDVSEREGDRMCE